ncbi:hypothetical protein IQ247_29660 [Plectonema cf. radiosum LEGE 06105]|uniref:Uncharacterized protein n=1 Tax=Plectonema cf. radiosum LEGE 06105 TaxID=945769 RepID=A0A8J7F591_9CYAN|nr:hypothetical protein [Plectonema radiosum]MBE9216771.1 hypothetical protein [Plectonema cf. radiosum LEGE 06105]
MTAQKINIIARLFIYVLSFAQLMLFYWMQIILVHIRSPLTPFQGASRAVLMMAEIGLFQVYEIKPNSYINIDDIIKPKS